MLYKKIAIVVVIMALPAMGLAADPAFLKVTVQERGYTEPNVKINIPLSLIEVVADAIKEGEGELVDIDAVIDEVEREGVDVRKLWEGVKELGPTDFIEVQDEKEYVKVWKDRDSFRVTVTEEGQTEPTVLITFPLAIIDNILGDGTQPVTLKGIVAALKDAGPMQFVEVHDHGEHVRIWLE